MTDYEIGYGKPPQSGKFKTGQSGNPKGGAAKVKKSEKASAIAKRLGSEEVTLNGKKMTFDEVIFIGLRNKAAKGDLPSIKAYYAIQRELGLMTPAAATGGGVLVVPGTSEVAAWTAAAKEQQAKFRGEDPEGLAELYRESGMKPHE